MEVGVVQHAARDERPAVEPFLRVAEKPDSHRGAGQEREDRAGPSEQLAVDGDVELERTHGAQHVECVRDELRQRSIADGQHVLSRDYAQQVEHFAVFGEEQRVNRGAWILLLQPREHCVREHEASHFRQQDDEDPPRACGQRGRGPQPVQQREQRAQRCARVSIDCPLECDVHP